ncbi:zinc-binding dehydrogenase [Neptunicella sp. SCSIO 80796]
MQQDKFKAVIDKIYPLEDIRAAFDYVEQGQKTGNVVIAIESR